MQANKVSLNDWLLRLESMHPKAIDMGLDRVASVARVLELKFACPVITVGGTNGKGSTCAMLESILLQGGYRVGLYTSPHLLHFNERARINGELVSDTALCQAFEKVDAARQDVSLTYFEFSTLAILTLFAEAGLDAVILEVGLGGRLDAVNIIDADVAIVTSVDLDHQDYLGDTREAIGFEKAGIYRSGRTAICSDPSPPSTLIEHAKKIGADLWLLGAQEIRSGLVMVELPGRFQVLPGRPQVILDVAHNPHAAATLAQNLDNMGFFPVTYAIFGAMSDKDVLGVVSQLKDKIDHWYLTGLPLPRAADTLHLADCLQKAGVSESTEKNAERTIRHFSTPQEAFNEAKGRATENDRIAVFGSFLTVAGVMSLKATD